MGIFSCEQWNYKSISFVEVEAEVYVMPFANNFSNDELLAYVGARGAVLSNNNANEMVALHFYILKKYATNYKFD